MNPNDSANLPLPPRGQRPPKAWRAFRLLTLLLATSAVMLFVGHRYGDRLAANVRLFWSDATGSAVAGSHEHAHSTFFTCGMHPWVILPEPGTCPICHMDLTPLDPSKFTGQIAIDPVVAQNIGVRTEVVTTGPLVHTVRTVGKVDYDETRRGDVNLRVAGWIEKLHVDFLGAAVQKGQALFELYSPELFSTQQEYLLAKQHGDLPAVAAAPSSTSDAARDLAAARARLRNYGIDDDQIAALERAGAPQRTMTITSPYAGTVIQKMAVDGMRVEPGMAMYRIADLSRVWVQVTVYEYQLPFVELGQPATMTLSYVPGQRFAGRVEFVSPWTDEKTREVNVRLAFDNDSGLFKPGMFANIELQRTLAAARTLVPRSAVLDTGARQIAFVSLGDGRFEPRDLRLGADADDGMVEVMDGLAPGERVVTSGQFLLDSESKLREALARMVRGGLATAATTPPGPELPPLPSELGTALEQVIGAYLTIGQALAGDRAADLAAPARRIAGGVDTMLGIAVPGDEHFWHQHDEAATVRGKALELVDATDLAKARLTFTDLSVALGKLLRATGVPPGHHDEVVELHCPMFLEQQGGSVWLQTAGDVRNPYFGAKMLGCFDRRTSLPPGRPATAAGGQGR